MTTLTTIHPAAPARLPAAALSVAAQAARETFRKRIEEPMAAPFAVGADYLVKGMLGGAGCVSLLRAPSNTGKTAVAILLARHVATNEPLAGMRVRGGAVLYVAAEAPGSVKTRLEPHRAALADVAPVRLLSAALDLRDGDARAGLIAAARELPGPALRLVVFDTLVNCIGDGDENASYVMNAAVAGAKEIAETLGAHVMLIHHTGHQHDRARGSSATTAAVDTELALKTDDDDPGLVRASAAKQRDMTRDLRLAIRLTPRSLGVDEDGDEITTVEAVVETDAPPPRAARRDRGAPRRETPRTDWAALAHDALAAAGPAGLTASEAADALPADGPAGGLRKDTLKKRMREALRRLAEDAASGVVAEGKRYRLSTAVGGAASPALP